MKIMNFLNRIFKNNKVVNPLDIIQSLFVINLNDTLASVSIYKYDNTIRFTIDHKYVRESFNINRCGNKESIEKLKSLNLWNEDVENLFTIAVLLKHKVVDFDKYVKVEKEDGNRYLVTLINRKGIYDCRFSITNKDHMNFKLEIHMIDKSRLYK